ADLGRQYWVRGVLGARQDRPCGLRITVSVTTRQEGLPTGAATPAASLFTGEGVERDREPILVRLLARLEHHYDLWREGGLDAIYVDLGSRDFLRGRRVDVNGLSGTAVMIDRQGRLEIEVDGEHRTIESGEVTYER